MKTKNIKLVDKKKMNNNQHKPNINVINSLYTKNLSLHYCKLLKFKIHSKDSNAMFY